MPVERIYIARHGFRASFNPQAQWTAPTGTPRDSPLTAHGIAQAKELAAHLASLPSDLQPSLILSSAYYRCLTTAAPVAEALGLRIGIEEGIGEWYLPATKGLHPKLLSPQELANYVPSVDPTLHSSLLRPSRRGESPIALHSRTSALLRLLLDHLDSLPPSQCPTNVLLVTHAATNIALGRALTGDPDREVRTGCCSLGEYVSQGRRDSGDIGSWKHVRNGDCSFLVNGEERNWAFSYVEEYEEEGCEPEGDVAEPDTWIANPHRESRHPRIRSADALASALAKM